MIKKALYSSISSLFIFSSFFQEIPLSSYHFMNPYRYNSAYTGIEGSPAVLLSQRKQWLGIVDTQAERDKLRRNPLFKDEWYLLVEN